MLAGTVKLTGEIHHFEVNTHHFLDEVFDKCMPAEQQALIKEGLSTKLLEF